MPSATSPAANSGDKTLSVIISGLAAGTPLTLLSNTFTLSASAFETARATSAMLAATTEQDLACSEFLRVSFMIWLFWFCFCCAVIDRALETPTRRLWRTGSECVKAMWLWCDRAVTRIQPRRVDRNGALIRLWPTRRSDFSLLSGAEYVLIDAAYASNQRLASEIPIVIRSIDSHRNLPEHTCPRT
jgi:hypothetical protein